MRRAIRTYVIVVCKMYVYCIFKKIILYTIWLAAISSSLVASQLDSIVYFMASLIKINMKIPDH